MTFKKYQTANNAKAQLDVGISASITSLIVKSWFGALYPTHNGTTDKNYLWTVVKFDTDWKTILKEEIVEVTARVGDTFSIIRSAGICPGSDASTTQGTTAYSFDAGDYFFLNNTAELIKDIQDETTRLETDKADDADVVHKTWNETVWWIKTHTSFPVTPSSAPSTDYQTANKKYVDDLLLWITPWSLQTEGMPWEDIDILETIFNESWITFAEATTVQNIGDVAWNTRYAIKWFWNWSAMWRLKASIKKILSPSVDLNLRIENDNAWSPSWTLVDSHAVANIPVAILTTSFVDSDFVFSWTKITNSHWVTQNSTWSTTSKIWLKFTLTTQSQVVIATKHASCTATKAYLYSSAWVLLATAYFVSDVATFAYWWLVNWQSYYILVDNAWSSFNNIKQTWASAFPYVSTELTFVGWGSQNSATDAHWYTLDKWATQTDQRWIKFTPNVNISLLAVEVDASCTATKAYLKNAWSTLQTVDITSKIATFSTNLTQWTEYYLEFDNAWSGYTLRYKDDLYSQFPIVLSNITIVWWTINRAVQIFNLYNIKSVSSIAWVVDNTDVNSIVSVWVARPLTIADWTKVHAVIYAWTYWSETVNATNYFAIWQSTKHTTTRTNKLWWWSSRSAWANTAYTTYYSADWLYDILLSLTDADYSYKIPLFPMVATETKMAWNAIKYTFEGLLDWFTNLETWKYYFLWATPGSIQSTPWTNNFMIWLAVSTTTLLIRNLSRKAKWTSGGAVTVTIGFYPTIVMYSSTDNTTVYFDEAWISNKTETWFDISGAYDRVAIW